MTSGPPWGVTPAGFAAKQYADCYADVVAALRANVDPNFTDADPSEPLVQFAVATATEAAALWQVAEANYYAINPNAPSTTGFLLDGVASFTGTKRTAPRASTVVATMGLGASASIPAGAVASVTGQPTNTWQLLGPGDPTTGALLAPGAVVSGNAGSYYGYFQATSTGPVAASAGTLTVIATPVAGWTSVTNASDAVLGAVRETDPELNSIREEELAAAGGCTLPALEADLLEVPGVVQVIVQDNDGDTVDTNGVPPHGLHVIIYDGVVPAASNDALAACIQKDRGDGVPTYGATAVPYTDTSGTTFNIYFDRATPVRTYAAITITTGTGWDPTNGPGEVAQAVADYWASIQNLDVTMPIDDLRAAPTFAGSAYRVAGVTKVSAFTIGTVPSPTGTSDLAGMPTAIYTLSSSDVAVTVV